MDGTVYLVGAGPGDPGLLTLRGAQLLAACDVVVYDYLANPRLLAHAPRAEAIYVGKKAAAHSMTQEQINALLVDLARKGKRVVRLKGGDPFIFGRGGEECEALNAAGIGFEVVPGITAAVAAPAYAGIPVTHRDSNSSFTLITGHEKEEEYRDDQAKERGAAAGSSTKLATGSSDVDWASIAKLPCVAFYMGVQSLPRICAKLIEHGMDPSTPAATIRWGTTPLQRTVAGVLADLPRKVSAAKLTAPAITIVGKVVELRKTMNWFETRPLFGQTIVVTRTRQDASELADRLRELGANVMEAPTIELVLPADPGKADAALAEMDSFDWVIFTSANGVQFARERLMAMGKDARAFGRSRVAAVGQATADAVRKELCLTVDLCPKEFVAEALAEELSRRGEISGKRFLLLRADIARPLLRHRLEALRAAEVRDVAIYETKPAKALPPELLDALAQRQVDWITFTSSSTAKNFVALLGEKFKSALRGVKLASIGPVTSATLRDLGLKETVQAEEYILDGLVAAIRGKNSGGAVQ